MSLHIVSHKYIYHLPLCSNFFAVNYFSWGRYWFEVTHPTATKWRRGKRSKASMSQWTKRSKTYWERRYLTENVFLHDCGIQTYQPLRLYPRFRVPLASCINTAPVTDGIRHQCENKHMAPAPSVSSIWTHSSNSKRRALSKKKKKPTFWAPSPLKKKHSSLSAVQPLHPSFHSRYS